MEPGIPTDSPGQMHLTWLDFSIIGAYLAGLSLLGITAYRQQTSRDAYFLGERRTHWFLAGVSVIATLLSTISYLSAPGEMIRCGVGFFSANLAVILVIPFITGIIIPVLMRLPVTTVYEYLEQRFSVTVRTVGAVAFVLTRLIWMSIILYTASRAVSSMTGWNIPAVIFVIGVVTTFYTSTGGMRAVIWSDCALFLLLFGGAVFIPVYVAVQTGSDPSGWWQAFSQAGRTSVPVFSFDPTERITIVGMVLQVFLWHMCTHGADQVAAQRYLSTPSAAAARRSVWVSNLCGVSLSLLLMTCGLSLFYFHLHHSELPIPEFGKEIAARADDVLPNFIATQLPAGLSGLMLTALLAAAMSSLSSGINSISAVVITDFVQRLNRQRTAADNLELAIFVAVLSAALSIGLAWLVDDMMQKTNWNLLDLMERVNHLFVAPLGAIFLAGILFRRVGATAVLLGFLLGVLTSILVSFNKQIFGMHQEISFMWIVPASFGVSLAVSCVAGYLFRPPAQSQLTAAGPGLPDSGPDEQSRAGESSQ